MIDCSKQMMVTNLVERHSEASINIVTMKQRYPHDSSNKVEVREMVRVDTRVCINLETIH